jgi:hypothetical protein
VSYVTGLPRTWSRLWEPTITGVFGPSTGKSMRPNSSQIIELGLDHRSVGASFEHRIMLNISVSSVRIGGG